VSGLVEQEQKGKNTRNEQKIKQGLIP